MSSHFYVVLVTSSPLGEARSSSPRLFGTQSGMLMATLESKALTNLSSRIVGSIRFKLHYVL